MICAGCNRQIEIGDHYIEDTITGFLKEEAYPVVDDLVSDILGGSKGKVCFCEDCCTDGGDYRFETFYGDEDEE